MSRSSHIHNWRSFLLRIRVQKRSDMFPLHNVIQQRTINEHRAKQVFKDIISRASGGARRDRTDDLMLAKHALSQLSYGPKPEALMWRGANMVGLGRLELPTSRLSSARSNQLSYKPELYARPASFAGRLVLDEERETKTAAIPHDRPDWPFCSKSSDKRKLAFLLEGTSLERR